MLVEYDIVSDSARVLEGIPQDLCVGTSQYSPDGSYIIGICYYTKPRKYAGQIGGYSPSVLFKLDFVGNFGTKLDVAIVGYNKFFSNF